MVWSAPLVLPWSRPSTTTRSPRSMICSMFGWYVSQGSIQSKKRTRNSSKPLPVTGSPGTRTTNSKSSLKCGSIFDSRAGQASSPLRTRARSTSPMCSLTKSTLSFDMRAVCALTPVAPPPGKTPPGKRARSRSRDGEICTRRRAVRLLHRPSEARVSRPLSRTLGRRPQRERDRRRRGLLLAQEKQARRPAFLHRDARADGADLPAPDRDPRRHRLWIVTPKQLARNRRHAYLVIAVVAMVLPGTDPISKLLERWSP